MSNIAVRLGFLGVLLAQAAVVTSVPAQASGEHLRPYRAVYGLYNGDRRIGESVFTLTYDRSSSRYIFESYSQVGGILRLASPQPVVERSEFTVVDGHVHPLVYVYRDGTHRGRRNLDLRFDWNDQRVALTRAEESSELSMPAHPLDRASVRIALALALGDMRSAGRFDVADPDVFHTYAFEDAGTERIDTPVGELVAHRIDQRREGSSRWTLIWAVPALDFHAARIEQHRPDRDPVAFALETFEWVDAARDAAEP